MIGRSRECLRPASAVSRLLVAGMVAVLCWLSMAGGSPAAANEASFPLASGDKVTITVFGQPDLSGDYVIDGAGDVHVPLVGRVRIGDLDIRQAEERVQARLADGYVRNASVSLRAAELKPIYVLGEVRSPGSYPYRFGMTVLGALALAGGHRATDQPVALLRADFLASDERLRLLEVSHRATDARRIRLEAQRDGSTRLVFPDAFESGSDGLDSSGLVSGEREIFAFQLQAQASEVQVLRQLAARLETERTALAEQARLEAYQVELTQSQVDDYNRLMEAGHARRPVLVERQRDDARARGNLARLRAEAAKNETGLAEIRLRLTDAESNFRRRVVMELQEARQRLLELDRSLPVAREVRDGRLRQLVASGGSTDSSPGWEITIVRPRGRDMATLPATDGTPLQPGDIVKVAPAPTTDQAGPSGAASGTRDVPSKRFQASR